MHPSGGRMMLAVATLLMKLEMRMVTMHTDASTMGNGTASRPYTAQPPHKPVHTSDLFYGAVCCRLCEAACVGHVKMPLRRFCEVASVGYVKLPV